MFWRRSSSQHASLRVALRRDPAMRLATAFFLVALAAQGLFWHHTSAIKPEMGIVPDVPGERTVRALSFGDEEAFFRLLALNIQSSGDTFGRFTALYKYDYNKLYHWFRLLGNFNNESNYLPAMASYYFSQTQNPADVRYLLDYLEEYTAGRPKEKWWWVIQASYMASHKLKDLDRALKLANTLRGVRGIPIWAQQMSAFLHEQKGEFGEALAIIEEVMKHPEDYSQGELNFMMHFVKERLNRFDQLKQEFEKIQKQKDEMRAKGIPDPEPMGPPKDVGAPSLGGE
jgi:tetratricopeptide (TPR) repeat protein